MMHSIHCNCGKLKGQLQQSAGINRCICYCSYCQAFARFLQREDEILDYVGGTDIIQTLSKHVTFSEGTESLACIRLTEQGPLRWYASCCNTPIGNTAANAKVAFIGLVHTCLNVEQSSLDKAFGPVRTYVSTESAIGEHKPKSVAVSVRLLQLMGRLLKARLDGSYKQAPFFELSGNPIATPKGLNSEELARLMRAEVGHSGES